MYLGVDEGIYESVLSSFAVGLVMSVQLVRRELVGRQLPNVGIESGQR